MNKTLSLLLLLVIGCGEKAATDDRSERATHPDSATSPVEHAGTTRPDPRPPEAKTDTIQIEGMPEEIALRLVESPPGFEPAFHTYVPEDMSDNQTSSGEGTGWRFNARFAGNENPEAFMLVFFYPENTSDDAAGKVIDSILVGRTPVQRDAGTSRRYAWSEREYSFSGTSESGQRIAGSVALGRHNGRLFHVLVEYPVEYGDGFGPRVYRVLSEWRWADGSSLRS